MKIQKAREIIIEFERVQLIRKRAQTRFVHCEDCRTDADFVSLSEAATLFNTKGELLFQFIKDAGSHYQTQNGSGVFICLNSLLVSMKTKTDGSNIKMIHRENK